MSHYFSLFGGFTFLMFCVATTGCASIFCSGNEYVDLTSTPPKAHVEVLDCNNNGTAVATATTPCKILVARGAGYFRPAEYRLRVSADGYANKEVPLIAGMNGMYLGNMVIGGALGFFVIDPLSGAMFSFPDTHIDLAAESASGN